MVYINGVIKHEYHNMKRKGGRPKWVPSAEDINKAETYAKAGLTEEQIAHALGICYDTLNNKKKEYVEFSEAIKRGKALGIGIVASELMKLCVKEGNVTAMIFFLKTRAGWTETQVNKNDNTHSGKNGQPIQYSVEVTAHNEHWRDRLGDIMEKK